MKVFIALMAMITLAGGCSVGHEHTSAASETRAGSNEARPQGSSGENSPTAAPGGAASPASALEGASHIDLLKELRRRAQSTTAVPKGEFGLAPQMAGGGFPGLEQIPSDAILTKLIQRQQEIFRINQKDDIKDVGKVGQGTAANPTNYPVGPGDDDTMVRLSDSVVAVFPSSLVERPAGGKVALSTSITFGQRMFGPDKKWPLCSSERFREQPVGAKCTGFLAAPDIVVTAAHCVDKSNVTETRFVFGYVASAASTPRTILPASDVYSGREIIHRKEATEGKADDGEWALVRLDRTVVGHTPASVRREGVPHKDDAIFVIGHPSGLPLKYAGNAVVREVIGQVFRANLDTYGGNSGSPVFNKKGVVEGILIRGETDFEYDGTCVKSIVCPDIGCGGEIATLSSVFAPKLPK
ncbi:trypsin-like serine peptidase [Polyangium fumosum]|nr:serine protease [Polyangium fumosum]